MSSKLRKGFSSTHYFTCICYFYVLLLSSCQIKDTISFRLFLRHQWSFFLMLSAAASDIMCGSQVKIGSFSWKKKKSRIDSNRILSVILFLLISRTLNFPGEKYFRSFVLEKKTSTFTKENVVYSQRNH